MAQTCSKLKASCELHARIGSLHKITYFLLYSPRERTLLPELFFSILVCRIFSMILACTTIVRLKFTQLVSRGGTLLDEKSHARTCERAVWVSFRAWLLSNRPNLFINQVNHTSYSTPQQQNPSLFFPKVKRIWESASRRGLGKKSQGKAPWGRGWGKEWRAPLGLRSGRDKMTWREYNYNLNIFRRFIFKWYIFL